MVIKSKKHITIIVLIALITGIALSQSSKHHKTYRALGKELPKTLEYFDGTPIKTKEQWITKRRPEILSMFEETIYGAVPYDIGISSQVTIEESNSALNDLATRKQIALHFKNNGKTLTAYLLIYLPKNNPKAPIFLGYNYYGNHTILNDPEIILTTTWVKNKSSLNIKNNTSNEVARGARNYRWPVKRLLEAGYGLATLCYNDIDPDFDDFSNGIHSLLYANGQSKPDASQWGAISAWSWGLSKVMDYFETDSDIDSKKVILVGHSRLGKTALWTAAQDQRFAMCIANGSGCGGAALFRRQHGETIKDINRRFPHWFCDNFKQYKNNEFELPIDQHMLISLIAPRPLYLSGASEDEWADPEGEYLSAYYATPVYRLFGKKGLDSPIAPSLHSPIRNTIGFHIRKGEHDVTYYDWEQFIAFSNLHFKTKNH
ncbi:glucuronyl esterase domain-containing protein [Mangrovimonas aestuarii]|uniref:glucuronyl esterase domain-containing protein n=1 Tax=Mangrovimonas aestuarii TaxID=3018443 RepID=UPI002377FE38|nr:acetylxylan esterase [Mangrovimonas aestuarii]